MARECLNELKNLPKYDDTAVTTILDKYVPDFQLIMTDHQRAKSTTKNWLRQYIVNLQKEINNGY
ncbi:hypothetical protein BDE27_0605 [Xenorhabdus ehlersii]|uniref:Uncharacterized protein n=1 Tax=Xenorhabdus ehlersii TaxID=290111 RepID=A0A2D0IQK4_9GAMM|nr:hypothetical protein Xehl_02443 [Xenorhabdus ehlersii]RKE92934.1 hypothetical protein BDE27_0605 [Xenorhabdus ehlersii]